MALDRSEIAPRLARDWPEIEIAPRWARGWTKVRPPAWPPLYEAVAQPAAGDGRDGAADGDEDAVCERKLTRVLRVALAEEWH